jgi:hypothetical protein
MDQTNLDIYGHPPIPWSRAERQLETAILDQLGLPDTSTDAAPPRSAFPLGLMIAAVLLALVATVRRSGPDPTHRRHNIV